MANYAVLKTCKIEGCNKKHWALGLCNMHYNRQRRHGNPLVVHRRGPTRINVGKCIIQGCNKVQYARHLCISHYWAWRKWGDAKLLKKTGAPKGSQNPNWKGGIAQYKNHSLMKKLRLRKLEQVNRRCECCGGNANFIYHKNGNGQDQRIENYLALCEKCFCRRPKINTKYTRLYGKTLCELAKDYSVSYTTMWGYLTGNIEYPIFVRRAKREGKRVFSSSFLKKGGV